MRLYYIWRDGDKKSQPKSQHGKKGDSLISQPLRERWLQVLSEVKQQAIRRLLNTSDQDSSLLGLRLLKYCAEQMQLENFRLGDIEHKSGGKPVWIETETDGKKQSHINGFDFNISHSDDLVIVAASRRWQVGVDAEKNRQLKRLDFKSVMQEDELRQIEQHPALFFKYWSIKEAVVKAADTAGLSRMRDVNIIDASPLMAELDGCQWYLELFELQSPKTGATFSVALATSTQVETVEAIEIDLETLLKSSNDMG